MVTESEFVYFAETLATEESLNCGGEGASQYAYRFGYLKGQFLSTLFALDLTDKQLKTLQSEFNAMERRLKEIKK